LQHWSWFASRDAVESECGIPYVVVFRLWITFDLSEYVLGGIQTNFL